MSVFLTSFFLILFLLIPSASPASPQTIVVSADNSSLNITVSLQVAAASPEITDPHQIHFSAIEAPDLTLGYSSSDLWFTFSLKNLEDKAIRKYLYVDSPLVGALTLYRGQDKNPIAQSGPALPLTQRSVPTRLGTFALELAPHEEAQFYVKRSSHHALNAQVLLVDPAVAKEEEGLARSIFFFYIGGIVCLALYNLFLGLFAGQKDHLIYSLFAVSFGATAMALQGVLDSYLFPNTQLVFSNYLMFFSSATVITASLFVRFFLNITKDFPIGYWGLRLITTLASVTLVVSFFAPEHRNLFIFGYWIDLVIASAIIFYLFCGFYSLTRRNHKLAYFFLISWAVILLGTFIWLGAIHGVLRASPFTKYSLLFANLGEMLVLSLGLAYKIKILYNEKRAALRVVEEKERYHRLVKVLSHDVANTVSGLTYYNEMLADSIQDSSLKTYTDGIDKSIHHLEDILRSVRQDEVFYAFKNHGKTEPVDLAQACKDAIKYYTRELHEKNIVVDISVPSGKYVQAERAALVNQVLSNLLSNAIKFSSPGHPIHFFFGESNDKYTLAIKDEGTGILPEDLPHIFQTQRILSRIGTNFEKGTGIGSSLVGEYMRLFGGHIEVESKHQSLHADSGTTVRLIFSKSAPRR